MNICFAWWHVKISFWVRQWPFNSVVTFLWRVEENITNLLKFSKLIPHNTSSAWPDIERKFVRTPADSCLNRINNRATPSGLSTIGPNAFSIMCGIWNENNTTDHGMPNYRWLKIWLMCCEYLQHEGKRKWKYFNNSQSIPRMISGEASTPLLL